MPSRPRREQLNAARAASVQFYKRRRAERNALPNATQLRKDDEMLNIADTSDTQDDSEVRVGNQSANQAGSGSTDEGHDVDGLGSKVEESKSEQAVNSNVRMAELKWTREGGKTVRGGYGKGSRSTRKRHRKIAQVMEKEASKTYNIEALFQRNNSVSSPCPLSEVPRGGPAPLPQTINLQESTS
ncbi:hypothetical protein MMC29_006894 [Sticta canariensis]|nr:hypothetical protein [Sticta canariensis]